MSNLQVFKNNEFGEIRGKLIDGQPYVVLTDVCKILGLNNVSQVKARLKKDGVITNEVTDSLGRKQIANFIDESNLYRVIFQSRKKEAEKFTDWVVEEVLPSIRKHGAYMTPEKIEEVLMNPDTIIQLATALKEEQQRRLQAERQIEEQKPKVLFAEAWEVSEHSILVGEMAKLLARNGLENMGQNRLFKWLRANSYLHKSGQQYNLPTQKSIELGIIEVKTRTIANPDGSVRVTKTPKITVKGQIYFLEKFKEKLEMSRRR